MKIIVNQTEENGIYSIGLKANFKGITFWCEHTLSMNKIDGRPYSKMQIETIIGNCIEDFIKRYEEQKEKMAEQNPNY